MALTAEILEGFVSSLLLPDYADPSIIPNCHREWWQMFCSDLPLVSIAAPRDHAKTTALTKSYGLGKMLFRDCSFGFIVSDTEEQAAEFVTGLGIIIKDNDNLSALFEIKDFDKDTETEIIVVFKDDHKFRFTARGVGQKVRGFLWGEKRPDLILIDDLENDKNVLSKEQRKGLKKWVNGALIPCRSKYGLVRAVGTIIHSDSWLSTTMPKDSSPFTIDTPLKKYSTRKTNGWYSALYRAHPGIGDYSQILWPDHHNAEHFKDEYARLEEDGDLDLYSSEYLNNPIDETAAYFKKADFREFPAVLPTLNYYAAVDFAISKAERADYTAIVVVGVDEVGQLYLVDVVRGRFDPDESISALFRIEKEYSPGLFLVEKGTLAHSMGAVLNCEMVQRRSYPQLHPVSTSGDKRTKARGIQKVMRRGNMFFDKSAEWYPALEDELLRFDRGRYDDQVDALALIGLKLDELIDAPTAEEQEEAAWDDEFGQDQPQGRDEITGY